MSGNITEPGDNKLAQLRAEMLDLQGSKDVLELEIESSHNWLVAQGLAHTTIVSLRSSILIGLDPAQTPLQLVDSDGFPKIGIDHHGARVHAQKMHCAINDHKKVVTLFLFVGCNQYFFGSVFSKHAILDCCSFSCDPQRIPHGHEFSSINRYTSSFL